MAAGIAASFSRFIQNPNVLQGIANVSSIAGTLAQAFGQRQAADAAQYAAGFNAQLAEQEADAVRQSSELQTARMRRYAAAYQSQQVTAVAKSGLQLGGSALEVLADSATEMELNILTEQYNADVEQRRLRARAQLDRYQQSIYRRQRALLPALTILDASTRALSQQAIRTPTGTVTTRTGRIPTGTTFTPADRVSGVYRVGGAR